MHRRVSRRGLAAAALSAALALVLTGCGTTTGAPPATEGSVLAPARATTGLPVVSAAQLPVEAQQTLRSIAAGGPFPYDRDGVVFDNREWLLPARPKGWYREYTVVTPGSADRGARRIVTGRDGARFYSDDHYASFREIVDPGGGTS